MIRRKTFYFLPLFLAGMIAVSCSDEGIGSPVVPSSGVVEQKVGDEISIIVESLPDGTQGTKASSSDVPDTVRLSTDGDTSLFRLSMYSQAYAYASVRVPGQ